MAEFGQEKNQSNKTQLSYKNYRGTTGRNKVHSFVSIKLWLIGYRNDKEELILFFMKNYRSPWTSLKTSAVTSIKWFEFSKAAKFRENIHKKRKLDIF